MISYFLCVRYICFSLSVSHWLSFHGASLELNDQSVRSVYARLAQLQSGLGKAQSCVCVCLCVRGGEAHMVEEKCTAGGMRYECITSGLFKNAAISIWTGCVCEGVPAAVQQSKDILQKRRGLLIDRLLCGVKWSWSETLH